ncbi:DUF3592 domain-containing protein [Actinoplanes awajinensis]|nr:DUF3592 domain-containing protein [Actinoplanes awajinensis]
MIEDGIPAFGLLVSAFLVLVPAGVGLFMIYRGLRHWNRARRLIATGERAVAVVLDNAVESHSHGRMSFLPVVTFRTQLGREVRTVIAEKRSNLSHVPGTQHTVAFDPEQPERAVPIDGQGAGMAGAVIVGAIFLLFAGVAFFMTSLIFLSPDSPVFDDGTFGDFPGTFP